MSIFDEVKAYEVKAGRRTKMCQFWGHFVYYWTIIMQSYAKYRSNGKMEKW